MALLVGYSTTSPAIHYPRAGVRVIISIGSCESREPSCYNVDVILCPCLEYGSTMEHCSTLVAVGNSHIWTTTIKKGYDVVSCMSLFNHLYHCT